MMKLLDFKIIFFCFLFLASFAYSQSIKGKVIDMQTQLGIEKALIQWDNQETKTNKNGEFEINLGNRDSIEINITKDGYQINTLNISNANTSMIIALEPIIALSAIEIQANAQKAFALRRMKEVEGTKILAGKKNEVVLLQASSANLATNNARQIYAQVVGLNIFDYNDGGLQLGIGGRGLNPNRTANFNTRQNDYDISADVLGYPESYYSPASEALKEIQVVRGAASLQYGTQFGGLINFIFKEPTKNKPFKIHTRNTLGSYGLYTNYTQVDGTLNKFSYFIFNNYKKGDGYRPNSDFESNNYHIHLGYDFNKKTSVKAEFTRFKYLAHQAGGLTDKMFYKNPRFSNRERNWFEVDWNLWNVQLKHEMSKNSIFTTHVFGLNSTRKALGFRSPRITDIDEVINPRDLLIGEFSNWGIESRFLSSYNLWGKENVFLLGAKYYHANNVSQQGPGSNDVDADFNFYTHQFSDYSNQSYFDYPNRNLAFFGENIFRINKKLSITPGFRFEYLNTQANGEYTQVIKDLAGNEISRKVLPVDIENQRNIFLLGIGVAYQLNKHIESYTNFSQNYRSVTFSDIHTKSPSRFVSPDITDEKGFTWDWGVRGKWKNALSYDINAFLLYYNNKIGNYIEIKGDNAGKLGRDNIGTAITYGVESFADLNLSNLFYLNENLIALNLFFNGAFTQSEYTNVTKLSNDLKEGNRVEFVPTWNLKTGIKGGYKNLTGQLLLSHVSMQYTDAQNSSVNKNYNEGVIGEIPAYSIVDLSLAYQYKIVEVEAGINNVLDNTYFVRRATGYPGPGIIPSDPRTFYVTFGIKF